MKLSNRFIALLFVAFAAGMLLGACSKEPTELTHYLCKDTTVYAVEVWTANHPNPKIDTLTCTEVK